MHITIMYYYYFNLRNACFFLHLYKYYYYVLCSTIYYILLLLYFSLHVSYIYIFQDEDGKDNKKKHLYTHIDIFFICRNKNTRIKILSNDFMKLFLCIHELCDLSNPSYLTYILSPFRCSSFSTSG